MINRSMIALSLAAGCCVLASCGSGALLAELSGLPKAEPTVVEPATARPSVASAPPGRVSGEPSSAAKVDGATASAPAVATADFIVAFRAPLVTLFTSESGQDAQRVPASTLTVPLKVAGKNPASGRLRIETLDGVRWVATSDVMFEPSR